KENLNAQVLLLHQEWPVEAAWTILPILPDLARKYSSNFEWVLFIEENTIVDLKSLMKNVLPKYNSEERLFLGRCLHDSSPTIIHHYAFFDGNTELFKYPDFDAGWLLSKSLLNTVADNWDGESQKMDFQIDIKYEIAMYLDKTFDIKLTCVKELCGGNNKDDCVTKVDPASPQCGNKFTVDDVLFSVKTTEKFHRNRLQVVLNTWGQHAKRIIYYSNVTDHSIPTIDCGVPNTPSGHCGKMEAIIKDAYQRSDLKHLPWVVIADDDSILSVNRMLKLLNCYNPTQPIVLGERYGFGLNKGYGYGYITGGGSMVMSRGAINAWFKHDCACPSIDTPDDMYLGQCFSFNVGVPVLHSPLFHQARPVDYAKAFLANQKPISFHKHWEIDPYKVYNDWFAFDDNKMGQTTTPAPEAGP
uniref:N-acetylgalactosaminide beta-1,3-galactosyltransferase n=1 Tax=Ciona savignyi TaxID=51511 RepID=H2YPD9_CIOSA